VRLRRATDSDSASLGHSRWAVSSAVFGWWSVISPLISELQVLFTTRKYHFLVERAIISITIRPIVQPIWCQMTRKRTRGAGRKPRGEFKGKTATITTRITPKTRADLERAAQKSGRSLSQEIEHRLDVSMRRDREHARKRHVRALAEAVALVTERVEGATEKRWLDDTFTGDALRHALEFLVFHFAPHGAPEVPAKVEAAAAKVPPASRDRCLTPIEVGQHEAGWLISWIKMDLNQGGRLLRPPPRPEAYVPDEWFTYAQLFSDLGSGWTRAQKSKQKEGR
jgi:hypothetical protein